VSPSTARPRRRKPTPAARVRPFWLLIVAIVVLLVIGGALLVVLPVMRPRTVIVTGNSSVGRDAVLRAAAVDGEANMWIQNTRAMAQRIEALPNVWRAAVHRRPPETIVIDVTERVPFALVETVQGRVVVDKELRVLDLPEPAGLPVFALAAVTAPAPGGFINDAGARLLRDDASALEAAHVDAVSYDHDKYGDLDVRLRNGVRVLFGDETEMQKKIPLVQPILDQVGRAGKPISAIDLRAPGTPIVVYRTR